MYQIEYDQRWDGAVGELIRDGDFELTKQFRVEVVAPPNRLDDCQSWAMRQLGLPELAHKRLTLRELLNSGFVETDNPSEGDLTVYFPGMDHYGIFMEDGRIQSKLGRDGALCIHPWSAFAGTTSPKFFTRVSE